MQTYLTAFTGPNEDQAPTTSCKRRLMIETSAFFRFIHLLSKGESTSRFKTAKTNNTTSTMIVLSIESPVCLQFYGILWIPKLFFSPRFPPKFFRRVACPSPWKASDVLLHRIPRITFPCGSFDFFRDARVDPCLSSFSSRF